MTEHTEHTDHRPLDFPIVGIGASAGGLESLERLFKHLPVDTGMAFVVIQHLSPDFKSLMDERRADRVERGGCRARTKSCTRSTKSCTPSTRSISERTPSCRS